MERISSRNSAFHDLSDALKGENNTIFQKMTNELETLNKTLAKISNKMGKDD